MDLRKFSSAIDSISAKTQAKLIIDPGLLQAIEWESKEAQVLNSTSRIERFKNVRLGVLLARVLDEFDHVNVQGLFFDQARLQCRIQDATILFCLPGASLDAQPRLYDLRAFTNDWERWRATVDSWNPPPPPRSNQASGLFSGIVKMHSTKRNFDDMTPTEFLGSPLIASEGEFRVIANWAGYLILNAPPASHRRLQQILALWENKQSRSKFPAEFTVYRYGDLPDLSPQFDASPKPSPLDIILPRVKCNKAPVEKVITQIASAAGTYAYVDWHTLQGASAVGPNSPVTLDLHQVTAAAALQSALDQSHDSGQQLGFACVDNILKVSSQSRLKPWIIRVYNVRDLIEHAVIESRLSAVVTRSVMFALASIDSKSIPDFNEGAAPEDEAEHAVQNILLATVKESWPTPVQINYFAGRLIICATPNDHRLITATLENMRSRMKQLPTGK